MKLKTLKDLDWLLWRDKKDVDSMEDELIHIQELKAEAVKWVKVYRKDGNSLSKQIAEEFMEFFNITEEDLK